MDVIDTIQKALLDVPPTTDNTALEILRGVPGRGANSYGVKLRDWLLFNREAFPERIKVECVDHMTDRGIDVLLTGYPSHTKIAFQIKSDNDLAKKDFAVNINAQMAKALHSQGVNFYIIIFACRPTEKNQQKYLHFKNEFVNSTPSLEIILPTHAAGLLQAFEKLSPILSQQEPKTWADFFIATKQTHLASLYLNWGNLAPDQRFYPPKEYMSIAKAVKTKPITILIGPPAIGKTFTALQVLWEAYQEGHEVSWIAPMRYKTTEGLVVSSCAYPDMCQRIEFYTQRLGLKPPRPPLDTNEFIAAHLEPNSIVYIEDPFGKLDDEFQYSLQHYPFFDLHQFLSAIREGSSRFGCHILITSREHLFERWLEECDRAEELFSEIEIIHIGIHSYDSKQCHALVKDLVLARNLDTSDETVDIIASHVDVPFWVEVIVKGLEPGATSEEVLAVVENSEGEYLDRLRDRIVAESDSERLFLLLSTIESKPNFYTVFEEMFQLLDINGDMGIELQKAMRRYRPFISREKAVLLERSPSGKGMMFVEEDSKTTFHLNPVHSAVIDAIADHLRTTSGNWLFHVASLLGSRTVEVSRPSVFLNDTAQPYVASVLLKWGIANVPGEAQDGILNTLLDPKHKYCSDISSLLFVWNSLPRKFKEQVWDYGRNKVDFFFGNACYLLNFYNIPQEDSWEFLRIVSQDSQLGGSFGGSTIWQYLGNHLKQIPIDLKTNLDKAADEKPRIFIVALCKVLIEHWDDVPQNWSSVFWHPKVLSSSWAQKRVLSVLADNWHKIPESLKDLFCAQAKHTDPDIRAIAATCALDHHKKAPHVMEPIYMDTLQDPDILVPLDVIRGGLEDEAHVQKFVEALYEKANAEIAADILNSIIEDKEPEAQWLRDLAYSCIEKGGELSQGVLCYHCFDARNPNGELMGYRLSEFSVNGPEPIRLAWLLSYVNSRYQRPDLTFDEVKLLIDSLSSDYRDFVLAYLSVQFNYLPEQFQNYLTQLEAISEADANSICTGKKHRQPKISSFQRTWGFPTRGFLKDSQER